MKNVEDSDLVVGFKQGSMDALEELIGLYQKPIFNIVLRIVRNREDTLDIVQSVFLKAYEARQSYNQKFKLFSWRYRIAVNESLNFLRRQERLLPEDPQGLQSDITPERTLTESELSIHVQDAIMKLKPDHRVVIVLRHFQECSYREIGEVLGVPEKTVKSRLFTAREQLRDLLLARGIE